MKKQRLKISTLLITYNEINHIEDVIKNVQFTDEIIVIDSFSNDGTFEILKNMEGVKVIQREFKNFPDQRNFALKQASHPWILFMDADERLTPKLSQEIIETIKKNSNIQAYKFRRRFMFQDKMIRFSGLQTDRVFRLFKNGTATYREDKTVHELLDVKGPFEVLDNYMLHYSYSDYNSYKLKTEHYGQLKAQELYDNNISPNWFHFYVKPIYKFVTNFIFRLGFLDGKEGFAICRLNAYGVYYRFKALEKLNALSPK